MTRKPDDIRKAIDTTLSGASHDPTLYHRVVNASKGDTPTVKHKLTLSMTLVLILCLLTGGVAVAATYRGVSWFLTENDCERKTLDPEYLMAPVQRYHTSHRLLIKLVDAYWDGVELFAAYHVAPINNRQTLAMACNHPEHPHYAQQFEADIRIMQPTDLTITVDEDVSNAYIRQINWFCEEDGSLTIMITIPLQELPAAMTFTVPVINERDGDTENAYLHFQLPAIAAPIADHEHDWAPATCVSPNTCRICGRTEGDLGKHDFTKATCITPKTCRVCGVESGSLSLHHQYGDDGHCTLCNKYYEYADKTK